MYAAPRAVDVPLRAPFTKTRRISFNVRNDSGAPLSLVAAGTPMTLLAGKTAALKLAVGDQIIAGSASGNHAMGDVITTVSEALSSATLVLK